MSHLLPAMMAIQPRDMDELLHAASTSGDHAEAKFARRREMHLQQAAAAKAAVGARASKRGAGRVGYIGMHGPISNRGSWWSSVSCVEMLAELRAYLADPSVGAILIDCDSPGGAVAGSDELSSAIYNARSVKPIVAIVDSLCASAAFWIASAASKLFVTPSGEVGSVGVFCVHNDVSELNAKLGVKTTYVSAGKYKVEGNPDQPLGAEAKAEFQRQVDQSYLAFVSALGRNRGVSKATARLDFGEGRTMNAREAVAANMCDGILTFEQAANYAINVASRQAERQATADAERRQRWAMMPGKSTAAQMEARRDLLERREAWARVKAKLGSDDPLVFLRLNWTLNNAVHFGGRLKQAIIESADLSGIKALACCKVLEKPCRIQFDRKFLESATPQAALDVLLHEQCHEALAEQGHADPAAHGEAFAAICNEIGKKYGWATVSAKDLNGSCAARLWPPRPLTMKANATHKVSV